MECLALDGACRWSNGDYCDAVSPNPCRGLEQGGCEALSGCLWGDVCTGTPIECYGHEKVACEKIAHCWWETTPRL
jgi:hypothetical protein